MASSWRSLCREAGLALVGSRITVRFADGRSQFVDIDETEDTLELHSQVAHAAQANAVDDLAVRIWRRNRTTQLVSFRLDQKRRLVAHGWLPKIGMTAEELGLVIRRVAADADRFEYLLTGKDVF